MKIIIAPDSFKGSLSAADAADAIERGVKMATRKAKIEKIPMADGGEGTVDALVTSTQGRIVEKMATDPLGNPVKGRYGILGDEKTAVIEMAAVSGLPLVPAAKRNPLFTTTYGTGELFKHALDEGCRKFIIGIGGSATNDGGSGMAQALGIKFKRADGSTITDFMRGELLSQVAEIDLSDMHPAIKQSHITVACDVDNPLLGPRGCAAIYAPQKGATAEIVSQLEHAMAQFIDVVEHTLGIEVRNVSGAGAAGGLGAGLMAFLNAELKPGIELVLNACHFSERITNADLILTGEGKLDKQTTFGKTIAGVCGAAKMQNISVIAFAGSIEDARDLYKMGLLSYFSLCNEPLSLDEAMTKGAELLESIAERAMRIYLKNE